MTQWPRGSSKTPHNKSFIILSFLSLIKKALNPYLAVKKNFKWVKR